MVRSDPETPIRTALVTGGSGFLGRWLVRALTHAGIEVTSLDRSATTAEEGVHGITGDINSLDLEPLVNNCDVVVHLAGFLGTESTFASISRAVQDNTVSTARVIEACIECGRRAVFTTVGNDWLNPYTITKQAASELALACNAELHTDFRVVKVTYGSFQRFGKSRKVVPTFLRALFTGESMPVHGDGEQLIDLIHAADVADALVVAVTDPHFPRDGVVEVGTGEGTSVLDLAHRLAEAATAVATVGYVGRRIGEPVGSRTIALPGYLTGSTRWSPKISLRGGLSETTAWYREHPAYLDLDDPARPAESTSRAEPC
jgi:UDP-glucose 4-epimerase